MYFLENKDHAEDHFTLDPRDQMNAIKDMKRLEKELPKYKDKVRKVPDEDEEDKK